MGEIIFITMGNKKIKIKLCALMFFKLNLKFYSIKDFIFCFLKKLFYNFKMEKKMNIFEEILNLNFFFFDLDKLCITFKVGISHKVCFLPLCDFSNLIFPISLKKI